MPIFIPQITGPATSNQTVFNATTYDIVNSSLRMVGAYASTDNPRPEQQADALFALNLMLKSWQVEGFLWLEQFISIQCVAGQNVYTLGPATADTVLNEDSTPFTERPTKVYYGSRKTTANSEIEMTQITRADWQRLPNKTATGTPIQFYYSPQTLNGKLYVYPTPSNSTDQIVLTVDRNLQTMVSDINSFDLPQEWLSLIKYGLALHIAPEYGVALGERQLLEKEFMYLKDSIGAYNRENASAFLQVGRN